MSFFWEYESYQARVRLHLQAGQIDITSSARREGEIPGTQQRLMSERNISHPLPYPLGACVIVANKGGWILDGKKSPRDGPRDNG